MKKARIVIKGIGLLMFAVLGCIEHPLALTGAVVGLLIATPWKMVRL